MATLIKQISKEHIYVECDKNFEAQIVYTMAYYEIRAVFFQKKIPP